MDMNLSHKPWLRDFGCLHKLFAVYASLSKDLKDAYLVEAELLIYDQSV